MGQRENTNDAALMDAQIKSSKEECVLNMEQSVSDAALKDAQVLLRREECASSMVQK